MEISPAESLIFADYTTIWGVTALVSGVKAMMESRGEVPAGDVGGDIRTGITLILVRTFYVRGGAGETLKGLTHNISGQILRQKGETLTLGKMLAT